MENKCYLVKLIKVNSTHTNLRTDEIVGYSPEKPEKYRPFTMFAKGVESGVRLIKTTPIAELTVDRENPEHLTFKTANSTYNIFILEECPLSQMDTFVEELMLVSDPRVN